MAAWLAPDVKKINIAEYCTMFDPCLGRVDAMYAITQRSINWTWPKPPSQFNPAKPDPTQGACE